MSEEELLHGSKLTPEGRGPRTASPGRICNDPSCDTVLSRYNTRMTCHLHQPVRYPRIRGVTAGRDVAMANRHPGLAPAEGNRRLVIADAR